MLIAGDSYANRSRIISFYLGNSARTQVSVLKQYLQVIRQGNHCPARIRSDRGEEVAMLADAHYALYCQSQFMAMEGTGEQYTLPPLSTCYLFGRSTQNQRIEALWKQLITEQTGPWIVGSTFIFLFFYSFYTTPHPPP